MGDDGGLLGPAEFYLDYAGRVGAGAFIVPPLKETGGLLLPALGLYREFPTSQVPEAWRGATTKMRCGGWCVCLTTRAHPRRLFHICTEQAKSTARLSYC